MRSKAEAWSQNKAAKYAALRRRLVRRHGIKDPLLESSTTMATSSWCTGSPPTPSSDRARHLDRLAAALLTPSQAWTSPLLDRPLSSFPGGAGTRTPASSRGSPTTQGWTPAASASMCSWPAGGIPGRGGAHVLDFALPDPASSPTSESWSSQRSRSRHSTGNNGTTPSRSPASRTEAGDSARLERW